MAPPGIHITPPPPPARRVPLCGAWQTTARLGAWARLAAVIFIGWVLQEELLVVSTA